MKKKTYLNGWGVATNRVVYAHFKLKEKKHWLHKSMVTKRPISKVKKYRVILINVENYLDIDRIYGILFIDDS